MGLCAVIEEMTFLQNLIVEIRGLRKEIGVEEKAIVPIEVRTDVVPQDCTEEPRHHRAPRRVSEVRFVEQITAGLSKHSTAAFDVGVLSTSAPSTSPPSANA